MLTGYFNANGDPCIEIEVSNPLGWKRKIECVIDTGFTGFLSIPMVQAFPIGLLLIGTIPVTLADGRVSYKLACLGEAYLGQERQIGTVLIEPSSDQALLGIDFLKKFNKRLVVDPAMPLVELVPAFLPPPTPPSSAPPGQI